MNDLFHRIEKVLEAEVETSFENGEWVVRVTELGVPLETRFPTEDAARLFAASEEERLIK